MYVVSLLTNRDFDSLGLKEVSELSLLGGQSKRTDHVLTSLTEEASIRDQDRG